MAAEAARVKKELLAFHPRGDGIDIVGTEEGSNGCTCENHTVACGKLLEEDMVHRLRKCQITDEHEYEMTAIAVVWVIEGNDRCRVGFLPRHCVKHMDFYNGRLVQVVNIYTELDDKISPTGVNLLATADAAVPCSLRQFTTEDPLGLVG